MLPKSEKYIPSGGGIGGVRDEERHKLNVNTSNPGHRSIKAEERFVKETYILSRNHFQTCPENTLSMKTRTY